MDVPANCPVPVILLEFKSKFPPSCGEVSKTIPVHSLVASRGMTVALI